MAEYWESIAEKATRFFSHGEEVFAECGEGVTCYVAECLTEDQAKIAAAIMEAYRSKLHAS